MKQIFLAGMILLMAACGNANNKGTSQTEDKEISPGRRALVVDKDDLGRITETTYVGVLPCADCEGIRYKLTLWNQEFSGNGTYDMITEYLGTGNPDSVFVTNGSWGTLRGSATDPNATVLQLNMGTDSTMNFLVDGHERLTLLNDSLQPAITELNYTLTVTEKVTEK